MILAREKLEYYLPQEEVQQQPQPHKQPRRKPRRSVVKQKILLTAMVLCCFVMGVMVAYYYAQIAYVGYKIDILQGQMADLRVESNNLEQEVNKLISLKQIEAIATTELGMVRPGNNNVVLVSATSAPTGLSDTEMLAQTASSNESRQRESITMPETPQTQEVPRNSVIQAFTDMVQRWNS